MFLILIVILVIIGIIFITVFKGKKGFNLTEKKQFLKVDKEIAFYLKKNNGIITPVDLTEKQLFH